MTEPTDLDEATYDRIDVLSQEGNVLLEDDGDWAGALAKWHEALSLVPEPKTDWDAALWLYGSIGEAYLTGGRMANAQEAYESAYRCPDGHLNPYVLVKLGGIYADQKWEKSAVQMLLRAYMLEGEAVFCEDPRHLNYLRVRTDLSTNPLNQPI